MLNISLLADKIIKIGNSLYITNTVLATWFTMLFLTLISLVILYFLKTHKENYIVFCSRIIVKFFYHFIYGIVKDSRLTWALLPLITTLFIYITFANWLGLVPGFIGTFVLNKVDGSSVSLFKSINTDLNTTFSMAIASVVLVKMINSKFPNTKNYLEIGVNRVVRAGLMFFEELSELTRVISLSFRLMGNIFAGEVLLLVLSFIAPYFVPVPFMLLEFFIGMFQAFVFAVLILIFVKW